MDNTISVDIKDLNSLEINPDPYNHGLQMKLSGKVICPITIQVLMNDGIKETYKFNSSVDTVIRSDWYEDKLSFHVDSLSLNCIQEGFLVKLNLLNR